MSLDKNEQRGERERDRREWLIVPSAGRVPLDDDETAPFDPAFDQVADEPVTRTPPARR
jgi:hypothetical protein